MTLKNALGDMALDATVQATNTLLGAVSKDVTLQSANGLLTDIRTGLQALSDSSQTLRRIAQLLKPLGQVTGGQSNRLSVDVANVALVANIAAGTIGTVTTVTGVTSVAQLNQLNNVGGVGAYELMRSNSRTAYNTGIRAKVT